MTAMSDSVIPDAGKAALDAWINAHHSGMDPMAAMCAALTAALPYLVAGQNAEIERLRDICNQVEVNERSYAEALTAKDAENAELKAALNEIATREFRVPFPAKRGAITAVTYEPNRIALAVLKKFAT